MPDLEYDSAPLGELTKHTPGPWEYIPSNEHHGPYVSSYAGDVADCYTMSNPLAASIRNGGDSYPVPFQGAEADANARLIAAAPDMLEALRDALELLERHYPKPARSGQIARARAAIAKAEGGAA